MAAEYSSVVSQIVSANQPIIYTESPVPCNEGLIFHRDGSGQFLASSRGLQPFRRCCKIVVPEALYSVTVNATVQVPEGGVVDAISLALFVDGTEEPAAVMSVTPAAVEEPFTVSTSQIINVPAVCRCSSVSVRNIGTEDVEVLTSSIIFDTAGVKR